MGLKCCATTGYSVEGRDTAMIILVEARRDPERSLEVWGASGQNGRNLLRRKGLAAFAHRGAG